MLDHIAEEEYCSLRGPRDAYPRLRRRRLYTVRRGATTAVRGSLEESAGVRLLWSFELRALAACLPRPRPSLQDGIMTAFMEIDQ